jgi:hypothetical protein
MTDIKQSIKSFAYTINNAKKDVVPKDLIIKGANFIIDDIQKRMKQAIIPTAITKFFYTLQEPLGVDKLDENRKPLVIKAIFGIVLEKIQEAGFKVNFHKGQNGIILTLSGWLEEDAFNKGEALFALLNK